MLGGQALYQLGYIPSPSSCSLLSLHSYLCPRFLFLAPDVYALGPVCLYICFDAENSTDKSSICGYIYISLSLAALTLGCHLHIIISMCLRMTIKRKTRSCVPYKTWFAVIFQFTVPLCLCVCDFETVLTEK